MYTEASLIKKLIRIFNTNRDDIVVGVGDDAAVLRWMKDRYLLATCDSQVEGVHFKKNKIKPETLVQRAVTASLSDIAAMGGTPSYILISLCFPKTTSSRFISSLVNGFDKTAKQYGVSIVGGNISSATCIMIDIFAMGFVKPDEVLLRSGAKPGDMVLVTGNLGGGRFRKPTARIAEGQIIAKSHLATTMIDISDGLSSDLLRICDASDVGVRLFANQLPIANTSSYDSALNSGEDYELCFTIGPKYAEKISAKIRRKTGTKVTIIGEILRKGEGRFLIDEKGQERRLEARGWDHFGPVIPTKSR